MMTCEPKVTGLSPMTGPPGTKITVRGENLGKKEEDIIRLTINGADCLPYLKWESEKKIITRCAKALGGGEVVITTQSGGVGTCDVQFNCYEESIGPTDESAVWVNEVDYQTPVEKERLNPSGTSDEYSIEISSSRFKPQFYLVHNHADANLMDLENLLKTLRSKLANKNDPEMINDSSNRATLLKSNLPVIMECLQILERLSKVITTSRDTSIDNIVRCINESLTKTHDLFDPLLAQKDLVQSIESAMQVFRQNETLFNLPSAIETSKKTKNYDSVVKEITDVISRLKTINIDKGLVEKIENDVTNKKDDLKRTIERQLQESCSRADGDRNVDDVKKMISHLQRLGEPINYDVWKALKEISNSLIRKLTERFDHYLEMCLQEAKYSNDDKFTQKSSQKKEPPSLVKFVREAMSMFHSTFYDIMALGQSYFDPKDEFACRDSEDVKHDKLSEFNEVMISKSISHLCNLLRQALIPDSPKLGEISPWPSNHTSTYVDWLKNVLESVIACHIHLTKVNLPTVARAPLEDFKELVLELRKRSMQILFESATRQNKNLNRSEDWDIEVDDQHGSITKLPSIFEKNVRETLNFANETIFKTSQHDEKSILKGHDVQAEMKVLAQSLINSFIDSLDNALRSKEDYPAESSHCLRSFYFPTGDTNSDLMKAHKDGNRLLITICNCQYTRDHILPKLRDEFEKLEVKMDKVFKFCGEKYSDYQNKICEKYCEEVLHDLRTLSTAQKLQIQLMIVNSQIFLIAPPLVNNLMTKIVSKMQDGMNGTERL